VEAWQWRQGVLFLLAFEFSMGHALVGMVLLVVLAVWELIRGEPLWTRTSIDIALVAFFTAVLLSSLLSEWRHHALVATAEFAISLFVVTRAVVLSSLRRPQFATRFLEVWAIGGVVTGLWSLARLGTNVNARADVPSLGPNELGTTLAIALVLLAGFSLDGPRNRRVLAAVGLPVVAIGLVLTWSRGAWLAAVLGLAVLLSTASIRRIWPGLLVTFVTLGVRAPFVAPRWSWHLGRLRDIAVTEGPFSRTAVWRVVPRIVASHPILGTGLSTFQFEYERYREQYRAVPFAPFAHNLFLNFAAETGVLGLAALFFVLGTGVLAIVRWYTRSPPGSAERALSGTLLAAFVALLGHEMFDGTVMRVHIAIGFYALLGLGVAGEYGLSMNTS